MQAPYSIEIFASELLEESSIFFFELPGTKHHKKGKLSNGRSFVFYLYTIYTKFYLHAYKQVFTQ